jgi:hypothetical protein
MEYMTEKQKVSLKEIEDLVKLAEDVHINYFRINEHLGLLRKIVYIFSATPYYIIMFLFSINFETISPNIMKAIIEHLYSIIAALLPFCIIFYEIFKFLLGIKKYEKKIDVEKKVLDKLHNMTTKYVSIIEKDISPMTKAILEMRLSRISFDV